MVVRLHGGLANQMFQYVFGESVSAVRNEEVSYSRPEVDRLYGFNIKPIKLSREYGQPFGDINCFDERVYRAPYGTLFVGYWQTEKYFDSEMVRREFTLKGGLSDKSEEIADAIAKAGKASAFLHVRRGDYVFDYNLKVHGMPSMRYYNEAIERIRAQHEGARFFVFSDDPEWCQANFPTDFTVISHNKTNRDTPWREHEDIWLMSLCHNGAIANSSFSWWGAWLGDMQQDRLVFAPRLWFTGGAESKDIVPGRWTKLEN
jgi:hypothetical protein